MGESGEYIYSQSSARKLLIDFFNLCIFIYMYTHTHAHKNILYIHAWTNNTSLVLRLIWLALTDKWWECLLWDFHLWVMIEKTLRHQATPESVAVFFLIHYTRIPTMGLTCSAYSHSIVKKQSWVLNLEQVGPKRDARTNINLVNVLEPCYRHCWALKKTECASEIMCVWEFST